MGGSKTYERPIVEKIKFLKDKIKQIILKIGWTTITKQDNTASNYVYTHQEDTDYIMHWFNRFSAEIDQLRCFKK